MALKNGRCHNCGSIIRVDDKYEDAVCMFCHAKTPSALSIEIDANPNAYTFENKEQADLSAEDQERAFIGYKHAPNATQIKKAQKAANVAKQRALKDDKPSHRERVQSLQSKPIEVPKVGLKKMIYLAGGILGILLLIICITLPSYISRTQNNGILTNSLLPVLNQVEQTTDGQFGFEGQKNQTLRIVYDKVTNKQVDQIYKAYVSIYAKTYQLDEAKTKATLSLYVITPTDGFEIKKGELKHINNTTITKK